MPGLEPGEIGHGTAFWRTAWSARTPRDILDRLFARMASRLGSYRAAWVLEATRPLNWSRRPTAGPVLSAPAFPKAGLREPVEPGRARLLPDRWVVLGCQRQERVFLVTGSPVTPDLPAVSDLAATDAAPRSFRELTDAQGLAWTHDLVAAESAGMAVRVPLGRLGRRRGGGPVRRRGV